jgi:serine/threonine protein kinase
MASDSDDFELGLDDLDDLDDFDDFDDLDRLDQLAAEIAWGGRSRPPLPSRWKELFKTVLEERMANIADPDNPLVKIGRFEAIRSQGYGGYGLVFEVRDPELDRHVALKLCMTSGPKAAAALIREAQLLAKLSHPNVITVYETGRHGDDVFFVMEFIKGKKNSGNELIWMQPCWQDAVRIYAAAGSGLAAAHDANIIHGDIKPGNILIDERCERPRVADFGLARVILDHAPDNERDELEFRMGTKSYMAPEVLRGQCRAPRLRRGRRPRRGLGCSRMC